MIRKQFYLEPAQNDMLKAQAAKLGVTEAELVRLAIDRQLRAGAGDFLNPRKWDEERSYIRKLMEEKGTSHGRRTWSREELYER